MNLALWLYRAGLSHRIARDGVGHAHCCDLRDLSARAARLAGALRERVKLKPGDRVAIAAKNAPDYIALLYGIWHAGLAAVPVNAKLHGDELAYILEQSGARVCFASPGIDGDIAPFAPKITGAADHHRQRRLLIAFAADPITVVPRPPMTLPGCSTLRAPLENQKAPCSAIGCWPRRAKPMRQRSIRLRPAIAFCMRRR